MGHGVLSQAFTSLSLFSILRMPLFQLPQLISQVISARVAIKRIEAFLAADRQGVLQEDPPVQKGAPHKNACFGSACLCMAALADRGIGHLSLQYL